MKNRSGPATAFLGSPACLKNKLKISLGSCLLDAKESCKNIQLFSCNNFVTPTEHWPFTCELSLCIADCSPVIEDKNNLICEHIYTVYLYVYIYNMLLGLPLLLTILNSLEP